MELGLHNQWSMLLMRCPKIMRHATATSRNVAFYAMENNCTYLSCFSPPTHHIKRLGQAVVCPKLDVTRATNF